MRTIFSGLKEKTAINELQFKNELQEVGFGLMFGGQRTHHVKLKTSSRIMLCACGRYSFGYHKSKDSFVW